MIRREHLEIARVFFALPESSGYGVGGGLAALVHDVIHRDTEDIDLFRDRRRAMDHCSSTSPSTSSSFPS